jgi:hypothetical protein
MCPDFHTYLYSEVSLRRPHEVLRPLSYHGLNILLAHHGNISAISCSGNIPFLFLSVGRLPESVFLEICLYSHFFVQVCIFTLIMLL